MPQTLKEFTDKWNGKDLDFDGYPPNDPYQCFDVYRMYCRDVLGVPQSPPTGDAGAVAIWDTYLKDHFTAIPNTPDGVPSPGDIVIFKKYGSIYGVYGHVAIVVEATVKSMTLFEQNYPNALDKCKFATRNYLGCVGWLHPKKVQSTQDTMTEELQACMADRKKFWEERDQALERVKRLEIELQTEKDDFGEYRRRVEESYRELCTILDPNTTIEIASESLIKNLAKKVVSDFSELQSAKKKLETEFSLREKELEEEIYRQEQDLKTLRADMETMLKRVERVESENERLKAKRDEIDDFKGFWSKLFSNLFKKG